MPSTPTPIQPATLSGKVALLTGAAGGIGRATASLFLQAGANLVLVDRNASRLHDFARTVLDPTRV